MVFISEVKLLSKLDLEYVHINKNPKEEHEKNFKNENLLPILNIT